MASRVRFVVKDNQKDDQNIQILLVLQYLKEGVEDDFGV